MNDWTGIRRVAAPFTAAVAAAIAFAGITAPADAHEHHKADAPPPATSLADQAATVDHASHGAASVTALATNCDGAAGTRAGDPVILSRHDGFQEAPTCSATQFGEVSAQANGPSLLIVDAPKKVNVGQPIVLKVSTRNLVRDRFLGAAAGGYYLETALLTGDGLTRGHFHVACRSLGKGNEAPPPDRQGDTFIAVEDGKGGAAPDTVTVTTPKGLSATGAAECSAWAGDGSHRVPMEQFANQIPAFDSVRLDVVKGKGDREDKDRRGDRDDG